MDVRVSLNKNINEILKDIEFYVDKNPFKIQFSPAFKKAFEEIRQVDAELLKPEVLALFKKNKKNKKLLLNLFRLQLRIILRRKKVIQQECPDDPDIKSLVDIFNLKIEALLKILEAQSDMEENDLFIEARKKFDTTIISPLLKTYIQELNSYLNLESKVHHVIYYRDFLKYKEKKFTAKNDFISRVNGYNTGLHDKFTKLHLDDEKISVLQRQKIDLQDLEKEIKDADTKFQEINKELTIGTTKKDQAQHDIIEDLRKTIEELEKDETKKMQIYNTTEKDIFEPGDNQTYSANILKFKNILDLMMESRIKIEIKRKIVEHIRDAKIITEKNIHNITEKITYEQSVKFIDDMTNHFTTKKLEIAKFSSDVQNFIKKSYDDFIQYFQKLKDKFDAPSIQTECTFKNDSCDIDTMKTRLEDLKKQLTANTEQFIIQQEEREKI